MLIVLIFICAPVGEEMVKTIAFGIHSALCGKPMLLAANGITSMRQGWLAVSPVNNPDESCSRSGNAAIIARAVSSRGKRPSIELTPRTLLATKAPIEAKPTATIDSATSTSSRVKPAVLSLGAADWHNVDPSRQPIDADLITES